MKHSKKAPVAKATGKPRKLRLLRCIASTRSLVAAVPLEAEATAPDVVRWGRRVFVLSEVQPNPQRFVNYREATQRRVMSDGRCYVIWPMRTP
jgi:hypothetical protein